MVNIPELSLVVLIGASGSGKSTFARRAFKPTEVLSSDFCRGLVSDDENDQSATRDAFDVLHYIAGKRLAAGRLTVVDATNVQPEARKPLLSLAREHDCPAAAIVLDVPEDVCQERNRSRTDRQFGSHVVRQQRQQLRRSLKGLAREGFRYIRVLTSPEEIDAAVIRREPSWTKRLEEHGPFDIIGDVHGCCDELEQLLDRLGYVRDGAPAYRHPAGRRAIFLGDIVDRGPRILDAVRLVKGMAEAGSALCVPGNHDRKLVRKLQGRDVQVTHGLEMTLAEIDALPDAERSAASTKVAAFFDSLVSH